MIYESGHQGVVSNTRTGVSTVGRVIGKGGARVPDLTGTWVLHLLQLLFTVRLSTLDSSVTASGISTPGPRVGGWAGGWGGALCGYLLSVGVVSWVMGVLLDKSYARVPNT